LRDRTFSFAKATVFRTVVVRKNDLLRELQLFQAIVERKNAIQILGNVLTVAITAPTRSSSAMMSDSFCRDPKVT
jgi:hypothetical protein